MSTTHPTSLRTHADWVAWIKRGKNKTDRPLGHNGRAFIDGDGDVVLRLHSTDVVIYGKDGTLTLNHGGWRTHSTFRFMDNFAPGRHFRCKGKVFSHLTNGKTEPKVRKCRTCKGEGSGTRTYLSRWDHETHEPINPAVEVTYEWSCWRCNGTGQADYGSKPLYLRWDLRFMEFDLNDNDPTALVPTAMHTWAVAA